MDGLSGAKRRQLTGVALAVCLTLGVVTAFLAAGATETARTLVTLTKHCEATAANGPIFDVENVSGTAGSIAQAIDVQISDRYYMTAGSLVKTVEYPSGTIHLVPGQKITVHAVPGWPWKSAYRPDHQYYVMFSANVHVKKKGKVPAHDEVQQLKDHEYCACKKPTVPTTTSTLKPTTTSTSTTSTSTTSTSTSTTSTSTSTTSTSTTTSTTVPKTSTTVPRTTTTLGET
jgi:hypothetical protein